MSIERLNPETDATGAIELSDLGMQIEMLRIARGISKQRLARAAGTSRQQLWRVMTGKSELTIPLRQRLAEILRVAPESLGVREDESGGGKSPQGGFVARVAEDALAEYLADVVHVESTLRSLPSGSDGRSIKRALLNALEDCAASREITLPDAFFDIRRRVLAGEL